MEKHLFNPFTIEDWRKFATAEHRQSRLKDLSKQDLNTLFQNGEIAIDYREVKDDKKFKELFIDYPNDFHDVICDFAWMDDSKSNGTNWGSKTNLPTITIDKL